MASLFSISGSHLWQWYQKARQQAVAADISPDEVDWLLQEIAGLDKLTLRLGSFREWPQINLPFTWESLEQSWQQRCSQRLPVQYITGTTPWRGFSLQVSPQVLIPRPETELLVDLAKKFSQDSPLAAGIWVDVGTGSGAIAIALAKELTNATIYATEIDKNALAIAQTNAKNLLPPDRITFYQGSWLQPLASDRGRISGMVSNPPYIPTAIVPTLQPEVANHEPHAALDGGEDGLDYIRHLIAIAPTYLHPGGILLFEMMAGQASPVRELLQQQGSYRDVQIFPDLAGIERFALAYKNDS
ncbi:peptide chain release factor N(5)-glutamine methyltransferase [Geitlerinema sp. PCC 9228]|jgi:release factor glutamine methyltransferase|uniref:peptide chain release factor N(5)-glutamine methyltransferase n=1 Tax=Geitlerinema sp. PCC 9228 TaxID=111611 RepID=UPI0008F9CB75|nr:peptide chain release factor N(5)-glutamine methyltransferase [Geitlerinema sp. PCC 9228]